MRKKQLETRIRELEEKVSFIEKYNRKLVEKIFELDTTPMIIRKSMITLWRPECEETNL